MSDYDAGSLVKWVPRTMGNPQPGQFTTTDLTFGVGYASGDYADCWVPFLAAPTGRARIYLKAQAQNDSSQWTALSPVVRFGPSLDGPEVFAASDLRALVIGPAMRQAGVSFLVEGLLPEQVYTCRLEHHVGGGTSTILRRAVIVKPAN